MKRGELVVRVKSLEQDKLSLETAVSTVNVESSIAIKNVETQLTASRAETSRALHDLEVRLFTLLILVSYCYYLYTAILNYS